MASNVRNDLKHAVVVVTGASSGIGRASALEFARNGATVLLAGRRREPLEQLARECDRVGGRGMAVPIDVTDPDAVAALAQTAVERCGSLDVWVNNASVVVYSRFGEEPLDEARRVIEVNVLGCLHGARAALPWFRNQGRGVLINVGSLLSRAPSPYLASYVMSKHAIRGLSAALRTELLDVPGIHVCTVMPGPVDTPFFQHAANHTGRGLRALKPTYAPETVARAIVSCAQRPRDEVFPGWGPRLAALQYTLTPRLVERVSGRYVHRQHFTDQAAEPTSGNLFTPMREGDTASGGWGSDVRALTRGVALAVGGLILGVAAKRGRRCMRRDG